ncbi:MAG: penicillin-binding protein activator LpoB [Sulfuricurvum sp.]|uniref:penicillin-binding protein activator LpoB n=1 Tax=Sulfuricurvum sp. TaxID=2025608 RepID=UPI002728FC30|nr:penicillin-binding protein activator LpoB [Sulfuricurvum sp.]MDO9055949.1 penicillin-binding protein activator LpoB [Sulfuricurvum sp.]
MKSITLTSLSIAAAALLTLSGCSAKGGAGMVGYDSNVKYGDAKAVETLNADFGSTDLQSTAETMTQSLLESRYISKTHQTPKVRLRTINNLTYEHIDTKAITDKIRIKLLKSGLVRFLADKANLEEVNDERTLTTTATTKTKLSAMTDADYIITGNVRSIKKASGDVQDVYYNISMELVDPQSGEVVWADEKEIRKVTAKSSVGW